MADTPTSFETFWPHYVRAHLNPRNRVMHAVGTSAGVAMALAAVLTRRPRLVPLALVLGYGPAWIGHFFIEGNRPATFGNPLWSLKGDFVMLGKMIAGTMDDAIAQATADSAAEATADSAAEAPAGTDPSLN